MKIHIFGSAAGGGLPQWNCSCKNCRACRENGQQRFYRTQSSLGISENGEDWVLINASPDIRSQFFAFPPLWPREGSRGTSLKSIILTDAQLDHTLGLLSLREGGPLKIYCTQNVCQDLTEEFPVFKMLSFYCGVERSIINLEGRPFFPEGLKNISVTGIPVRSKAPPYSPRRHFPGEGESLALKVTDHQNSRVLLYAPNISELDQDFMQEVQNCHLLLMDGTFWDEDELPRLGFGHKRASDMGHCPLGGKEGLVVKLGPFTHCRKILVHMNNTNPILDENSAQRKILADLSFELAYDGMDLDL